MIISVSMSFCTAESILSVGKTFRMVTSNQRLCALNVFIDIAKMFSKEAILISAMYEVLFPYTLTSCVLSPLLIFANLPGT